MSSRLLSLTKVLIGIALHQCSTSAAWAETTWYQIDLIAFANNSTGWANSEHWPEPPLDFPSRDEKTVDFTQADQIPGYQFQKLEQKSPELQALYNKLGQSSRYRTLFAASWRQPLTGKREARPLFIQGGQAYGNRYELEGSLLISQSKFTHITTDLWLSEFITRDEAEARGLITSIDRMRDQYIAKTYEQYAEADNPSNIGYQTYGLEPTGQSRQTPNDTDLAWTPELTPNPFYNSAMIPLRAIPMKQSRRLKNDETHYIDHPLMGIVVNVKKLEFTDSDSTDSDKLLRAPWENVAE